MYHYAGNNPIKYTDPDGNETYDSSITKEEFAKIQYKLPPLSESSNSPFNNPSWDDVQNFFAQNPNGCISRNPDEASYRFYTNEGKDKPVEYNMIIGDEFFLFGLGKGAIKLGKGLVTGVEKKLVGRLSIHGTKRVAQAGATRGGVLSAKEILKTRKYAQQVFRAAKNDTIVSVVKNKNGTYNMVVDGKNGLVSTFKNISEKSFKRLYKNYDFVPLQ